ncbi:hypothetical protein STEG23_030750, partial [Scotinomys teguina]
MEMKAAARCQLLLILLMSAVMLLPGTNGSLLLVQRTVTRTIVLQETIGKEKNICGSEKQTTEEEKEKRKKCLQGTRTTTKSDFEIFKRMTGSLNDDSTWTKPWAHTLQKLLRQDASELVLELDLIDVISSSWAVLLNHMLCAYDVNPNKTKSDRIRKSPSLT